MSDLNAGGQPEGDEIPVFDQADIEKTKTMAGPGGKAKRLPLIGKFTLIK